MEKTVREKTGRLGQQVLADFRIKKAVAVVFIGTECPLVNLYVLRLAKLQQELGPQGLQILAINSNYGPNWQLPGGAGSLMNARYVQIGGEFSY